MTAVRLRMRERMMKARCIRKWAVRRDFCACPNGQPVIKTSDVCASARARTRSSFARPLHRPRESRIEEVEKDYDSSKKLYTQHSAYVSCRRRCESRLRDRRRVPAILSGFPRIPHDDGASVAISKRDALPPGQ